MVIENSEVCCKAIKDAFRITLAKIDLDKHATMRFYIDGIPVMSTQNVTFNSAFSTSTTVIIGDEDDE